MANIKKTDHNKYWSGYGENAVWKTVWQFLKKKIYHCHIVAIPPLRNFYHRKEHIFK